MNPKTDFSFERKYVLKAQSPMLHFQHRQTGATLRATEVKPMLDAFLKKKISSVPAKWFVGNSDALNYKLHFEALGKSRSMPVPKIYYGNSGVDEDKQVRCVFRDCTMTVICLEKELMALINKYIGEFFVIHNFGRMKNKGFGSFTVENIQYTKDDIGRLLAAHSGASRFYYIAGYCNDALGKMFDDIATLYGTMKSGYNRGSNNYHRSYLFEYFMGEKIGNEKACMKKEETSPAVVHPNNRKKTFAEQNFPDYKYTRALLGVGSGLSYIGGFKGTPTFKNGKSFYEATHREKISIEHIADNSDKKIARLASPIFFKIIDNVIYIVPKRINENIFGKAFNFKNEKTKKQSKIRVPDSFDIDKFMKYFVDRYNVESQKKDAKERLPGYSIKKTIEYKDIEKGEDCL